MEFKKKKGTRKGNGNEKNFAKRKKRNGYFQNYKILQLTIDHKSNPSLQSLIIYAFIKLGCYSICRAHCTLFLLIARYNMKIYLILFFMKKQEKKIMKIPPWRSILKSRLGPYDQRMIESRLRRKLQKSFSIGYDYYVHSMNGEKITFFFIFFILVTIIMPMHITRPFRGDHTHITLTCA